MDVPIEPAKLTRWQIDILPVIEFKSLADRLVPLDHVRVWFRGERLAGNRLREQRPRRTENVPSLHCIL